MTQSVYRPIKKLAIFASGAGTNAARIIEYFAASETIKVMLIVCNNPHAGVLHVALGNNIEVLLIEKEKFFRGNSYVDELETAGIDFIALAGFLWKIPAQLIKAYNGRIMNLHPALLPKHGGKGMYGSKVHEAVLDDGESETGITIHIVDEHYDNGDVIFQARCPVLTGDTPQTLAKRVHELEYENFAKVIEATLMNQSM